MHLKKKNLELQQQKTVRLNDAQLQEFLDELTQRIEWSTNRIVDEPPRTMVVHSNDAPHSDGLSFFMKWLIAIPFFVVAIAIAYTLYCVWGEYWSIGWTNRISLFVVGIASFDCLALGIEICGYPFCSAERERATDRDSRSTKAPPKSRRLKRKEYSSRYD